MTILATFINIFTRGQNLASQIRQYQQDAIGFEVLEKAPNGTYAVAVIIKTEWDSSILNWQTLEWGDWCFRIKYLATGYETWVSADCLTLTGEYYSDLKKPFAHLELSVEELAK